MIRLADRLRALPHLGLRHRCPICRMPLRAFLDGPFGRPCARCPCCGSLERHRYLWLFLERRTTLTDDREAAVLHFAPESGIAARLARRRRYLSADVDPGVAMRQLDLQHLDLPDEHFDWVLCSHVLEHVPDDAAAMAEIYRVLRPGGRAIIQVPLLTDVTVEDPSLPRAQRLALFGQADHVRVYGPDFYDRLRAAAFEVELHAFRDELRPDERRRYGLDYHGMPPGFATTDDAWVIPLCRRPAR